MEFKTSSSSRPAEARILIVDDELEIRETLRELLEFEGYHAECAENGERALEQIARSSFDIVLTDLHMPEVDGMELIQTIKRSDPDLPVIVLSGYPTLRKAVEAMKCGAGDFLTKPFNLDTVLHVLRRSLKERALMLENRRLVAEVNNKAVIEKLNTELHKRVEELTKLNRISEKLGRVLSTSQIFQQIVALAGELSDAERVSLMLYDRTSETLRIRAASGISRRVMRQTVIRLGEGISGKVAQTRMPLRVTRRMSVPLAGMDLNPSRYSGESWISAPLIIGNQLFGVLNVSEKRGYIDFGPEDERLMLSLAEKAAAKVENNALYESLYDNLFDTLASLVTTLEAKDLYTHQHSQRVTDLAVAIGETLGLPQDDIESLRFATILHDIGKIGVRDFVLLKPSRLTNAEFEKIKLHPVIGNRIVAPLGLTASERDIIQHHHERLDGRGYPDGLKGDEITLLARIVSAADAFDAMTSTRSYRQALSLDQAVDELKHCAGRQFCSDVVTALLSGVEQGAIPVIAPEERLARPVPEIAV